VPADAKDGGGGGSPLPVAGGGGGRPDDTAALTARRCLMRSAAPAASVTAVMVSTVPDPARESVEAAVMHRWMSFTQLSRSTGLEHENLISPSPSSRENALRVTPAFSRALMLAVASDTVLSMPYDVPPSPASATPYMSMSVKRNKCRLEGPVAVTTFTSPDRTKLRNASVNTSLRSL